MVKIELHLCIQKDCPYWNISCCYTDNMYECRKIKAKFLPIEIPDNFFEEEKKY